MAEGFLEVGIEIEEEVGTWIWDEAVWGTDKWYGWRKHESGAHAGNVVNLIVHTKNTGGASDDFRVDWSKDTTGGSKEFYLGAGSSADVIFNEVFTMPDSSVSIAINTYHWEITGWVWDTSSVWEILFPFMNIHGQPFKQ